MTIGLPSAGLEPIDAPMAIVDESHGLGALNFPLPGEWTVKFTIRISEIDQATVSGVVNVP